MAVALNLLKQKQLIIFFKTCILLYLFIGEGAIAAKRGSSYVYKVRSEKQFTFSNYSISMIINGQYVKQYFSPTLYGARFKSLDVTITDSLRQIKLSNCEKYQKIRQAVRKPFLVNLRKSGLFKSMEVSKDELKLSVNLKYLLASLFQINSTAIVNSKEPLQQVDSHLIFGNCKLYYLVPIGDLGNKIYANRIAYGSDCDDFNKGLGSRDEKFLARMCKRSGEDKSQWSGGGTVKIMLNDNNIPVITEYNLTDIAINEPFKNSTQTFGLTMDTRTSKIELDPKLSVPRISNTNKISKVLYSPVNRRIMNSNGGDDITNIYKAFACGYNIELNAFMKLIELAESC